MKALSIALSLMLVFGFGVELVAADATGVWAGRIALKTPNGTEISIDVTLTLKVDSSTLTGTWSAAWDDNRNSVEILDGKISGEDISFDIPSGASDVPRLNVQGKRNADDLKLGVSLRNPVNGQEFNVGDGLLKRVGGGRGDRLPRIESADSDPPPGQSDDRGVYRSGGNVTAPVVLHRTNPEYTEQARTAKYQGTVLLSVEIDPSGTPTNIKVQRGLGLGRNEKAIEAVKQWKFKPGQRDGTDVSVRTTVEVIFRLQ